MKNVLVTTRLPREGFTRLTDYNVIFPETPKFIPNELLALLPEADILISTFDYPITKEMIAAAPRLGLIANFGVGYNNVDINAATERNIIVTNTPLPVIEPTAEHAFTLMLAISHRTAELDRRMREKDSNIEFGVMNNLGIAIYGKTLGIIGMGNIGRSLAARAKACGMTIVYHNRHRLAEDVERQYNATYLSLEALLRTSDFVSLNMPYTPESHHIINDETLSMMKRGAVLINTARGACVDEEALVKHLNNGHLYGAALDVYEHEPNVSEGLLRADNVVLSPHIGTGTIDGRLAMCECCTDNILNFDAGKVDLMDRVNLR